MISTEKPGTPEELVHFGVKGMRWGIRNEKESSGNSRKSQRELVNLNDRTKSYIGALKDVGPKNQKEYLDNLKVSQEKFFKKVGYDKEKGLTENQKKILKGVGVGTVVVGGVILYAKYGQNLPGGTAPLSSIKPGDHVTLHQYEKLCDQSKIKAWGTSYVTPEAINRPGFEIPAGNIFHRVSCAAETTFGEATYATPSVSDFRRYIPEVGMEKWNPNVGLHEITFKSTKAIRIPSMVETLNEVKEVIAKQAGISSSAIRDGDAINQYNKWSGGSWNSDGAKLLFRRLRSKGYGALIDEMDVGVIAEKPLVIFSKDVTPKVSHLFTENEFKDAVTGLTEITSRRL